MSGWKLKNVLCLGIILRASLWNVRFSGSVKYDGFHFFARFWDKTA